MQIAHSSRGGGSAKSLSSLPMRLHTFLWAFRWAFWHSTLQYQTHLQEAHFFRAVLDSPHEAQLSRVMASRPVVIAVISIVRLICYVGFQNAWIKIS